jgi:hypothetical protein
MTHRRDGRRIVLCDGHAVRRFTNRTAKVIVQHSRPLFLHAGLHKTGTTFIQSVFGQNRERLAQAGIAYPWMDGSPDRVAHHDLGRALETECSDNATEMQWLRSLDAFDDRPIVLSSETLSKLTAEQLARIRTALPSRTVLPVLFFREWSGALLSRWQQRLGHRPETLPNFMTLHLLKAHDVDFINYTLFLDKFAEAFGRENVIAVCYDRATREKNGLLDVMLQGVMGSTLTAKDLDLELGKKNAGSTPEAAAVHRLVHFALDRRREGKPPRVLFRRNASDFKAAVPELADLSEHRETLSIPHANPLFAQLNKAIYDSYGDRFVNPSEGRIFDEIGVTPMVHIPLEQWLSDHPEAIAKMRAVAETLRGAGRGRRNRPDGNKEGRRKRKE